MLLRSGKSHLEAESIAEKVKQLYDEECRGPFPYDDCRWLRREFQEITDDLIPDLDMWFFNIFGYASHGKRLIDLSEEDVLRARGLLSLSFFDKHPEHAWLKMHITTSLTPELHERLDLAERSRTALLHLLDLMLSQKFVEHANYRR